MRDFDGLKVHLKAGERQELEKRHGCLLSASEELSDSFDFFFQ